MGRGRPKGKGKNIEFLKALRPGDTVWDVSRRKMWSFVSTARDLGIKLMVRRIPNSKKYAFKIINEDQIGEDSGG